MIRTWRDRDQRAVFANDALELVAGNRRAHAEYDVERLSLERAAMDAGDDPCDRTVVGRGHLDACPGDIDAVVAVRRVSGKRPLHMREEEAFAASEVGNARVS